MKATTLLILILVSSFAKTQSYFPPHSPGEWERKKPEEMDVSSTRLAEAIDFAKAHEYTGAKDLRIAILKGFSKEPYHYLAGPVKKRGGPAGIILKEGYIIGEWGDLSRVDMTFSVTKSYLSTVAGLAIDKGLIRDVNDPVKKYVWDGTFDGQHNGQITWDHLLTQSSDWSGRLFGMRDWADRPPGNGDIDDWKNRKMNKPGTQFEYNDVRVNVLAYSLLQVWRQPLPKVLKQHIMDPIGASTTWRWHGYENSWVELDGLKMQSVSGGGHSGGGIFINTLDHARFGLLFLNKGQWKDQQIISEKWVKSVQQPSQAFERYGYMWWLNRGENNWNNDVPETVYYAAGFGGNFIVIDETNDLVVVTRWLEPSKMGAFMQKIMAAMNN